jgi:hypothetical protein
VIRRHHDLSEANTPMVAAVMLADQLAKELEIGYDGDSGLHSQPDMPEVLAKLSISEGEWDKLREYATQESVNIKRFFQIS